MTTMNLLESGLKLAAALGCGLMAGVFLAFSTFVMKALAKLPPDEGIAAMQAINVYAVRSWFVPCFVGTAGLCVLVALMCSWDLGSVSSRWILAGAVVQLVGTFLVTIVFNVPMNDALAALPAEGAQRAAYWQEYLSRWGFWNHVRTISSVASIGLMWLGR